MANIYYLHWYRGATLKGNFTHYTIDAEANPWTFTRWQYIYAQPWETFASQCVAQSDKLVEFPAETLFGYNKSFYDTPAYGQLLGGFLGGGGSEKHPENLFPVDELAVGDVIYFDSARSGSHITVSNKSGNTITLNYVCGDGTVAYNSVVWEALSNTTRFVSETIPWLSNFDDPGNFQITRASIGWNSQFGYAPSAQTTAFSPTSVANAAKFWGAVIPADPKNPYEKKGVTRPGGGSISKQNFMDDSDEVTTDAMPTLSATSTGLVTIFSPTEGQVKHLADVLWGKDFLDFLQNLVTNISDMFISFGMLPFDMTPHVGNTVDITFFDWAVTLHQVATNIPVRLVPNQFIEFDMGSIDMTTNSKIHRTDSLFDYSPYSRLGIYLPFIGFQELDIDEIRESIVHLVYRIDVLSGSCVAKLDVTSYLDGKTRTLYQFTGNCLTQIPLTSVDCQTMITNAVNLGIALSSAGATSAVAGAGGEFVNSQLDAGKISAEGASLRNKQFAAQVSNAENTLSAATANATMGMKPNFKHSGAIGASSSMLSVKQPYLFLTTPNEAVPKYYERYSGLPSNITSKLGDLSGYTVVEDIRLNGLVATSPEVEEIYKLLKSGVII